MSVMTYNLARVPLCWDLYQELHTLVASDSFDDPVRYPQAPFDRLGNRLPKGKSLAEHGEQQGINAPHLRSGPQPASWRSLCPDEAGV